MHFKDAYKVAVQYACDNAVVCDSLNDARYGAATALHYVLLPLNLNYAHTHCRRHLRFKRNVRVKAITLTGAVISKSGLMTGGTSRGGNSTDHWQQKEAEQVRYRWLTHASGWAVPLA